MKNSANSSVVAPLGATGRPANPKSSRAPKKRSAPGERSSELTAPKQVVEHLLEEHAGESEVRPVRLSLFQPEAREVFVAGAFSNWQTSAIPLARQPDGTWLAELRLNPGTYEYRFIVDGRWTDDPMAARYVANPFGDTNCVLEVKP